jgi:hypothetical protein
MTAYSDKEEAFNELLWYDTTNTRDTIHTHNLITKLQERPLAVAR